MIHNINNINNINNIHNINDILPTGKIHVIKTNIKTNLNNDIEMQNGNQGDGERDGELIFQKIINFTKDNLLSICLIIFSILFISLAIVYL